MTEINLWCLHTPESSVSTFNIFFFLNEQFEKQEQEMKMYSFLPLMRKRDTRFFLAASHWKLKVHS